MNKKYRYEHIFRLEDNLKNLLPWLEKIIQENDCIIQERKWVYKYNHYVAYTCEPLNPDDYVVNLVILADSGYKVDFTIYLYKNRVQAIKHLENCYAEYCETRSHHPTP